MGKLAAIYDRENEPDLKKVELVFPVVGKSVWLHRPTYDEEQFIEGRCRALGGSKDFEADFAAVVLKSLCDEPNLRDENEIEIARDIRAMESPDRKAILNTWEAMVGRIPKNLGQLFSANPDLFRVPERKPRTTT